MNLVYNLTNVVVTAFYSLMNRLIALMPQLIAAIFVFIFGLFVSEFVGKLVAKALREIYLDVAVDKSGTKKLLQKVGLKYDVSKILGLLATWFLNIVFLIAVADILNLPQITEFLKSIVLYIPNVVVAIIILVVGTLISELAYGLVSKSTKAANVPNAKTLALTSKWSILIFSVMAALVHLKVATELITILFAGLVLMIALAGGLSFGLGGREKAADWLRKFNKNGRP